jgi:protoheme IX farnesyltransferase
MIRDLAMLFRLRLALLNGIAAMAGVFLFPAPVETQLLWSVFIGVVLLAAGGSALNQVLECKTDCLMIRTRLRPVAQKRMNPAQAALIGTVIVVSGALTLYAGGGVLPSLLGAGGILWYLAVYTPLKRRSPYALAVGSLCGAVPPLIGWCAVGGEIGDFRIMLLAGVLVLWQIPHFWLFQRRHAADYRAAGFPLLDAITRQATFSGLFGLWVAALVAATMLLPAFGLISGNHAVWFALVSLPLVALPLLRSEKALFPCLNLFPLLLTLLLFICN